MVTVFMVFGLILDTAASFGVKSKVPLQCPLIKGKADVIHQLVKGPFLAKSGHYFFRHSSHNLGVLGVGLRAVPCSWCWSNTQ